MQRNSRSELKNVIIHSNGPPNSFKSCPIKTGPNSPSQSPTQSLTFSKARFLKTFWVGYFSSIFQAFGYNNWNPPRKNESDRPTGNREFRLRKKKVGKKEI